MYTNDKANHRVLNGFKSMTLNSELSIVMIKSFAVYITYSPLAQSKVWWLFLLQAVRKANKTFLSAIDKFLMDLLIRHSDPLTKLQPCRDKNLDASE